MSTSKLTAALLAGMFCLSVAQAQDKKPADKAAAPAAQKQSSAQQNKMADCNNEAGAKQLKGDERKQFMSSCLKGADSAPKTAAEKPAAAKAAAEKPAAAKVAAEKPADQKQKMGFCNKEAGAKQLKGGERKKFMSECLKA
ncbi:MAG: hypothetical protein IH606_20670 [Burkholderiales bacterium]|nr:hypothetical protein [Burkholderiales bacterium]